MSLPSPLTATDEYVRHREHGTEIIRITAGLHRQVWVSGTSIFVDVHIANNSKKNIRRLELQLERDILCYKHVGSHCTLCIQLLILSRLLPPHWSDLPARHEYLIAMNAQSSTNPYSKTVCVAGMEYSLTHPISAHVISSFRVGTQQSNVANTLKFAIFSTSSPVYRTRKA